MASNTPPTITLYLSLTSSPSTPRIPITLDNAAPDNASSLRRKASAATSVPLASLKLIFRGRVIGDKDAGDVVREFKLEDGSVVHVMGKPTVTVTSNSNSTSAGASASAMSGSSSAYASASSGGASVTLPAGNLTDHAAAASSSSSSSSSPLIAAFAKLRTSNDGPTYRTALATADKLLGNVVSHPMEEKYRTIKKSNPAFSKRLGALPGGSDLILASGFSVDAKDGVEYYVLRPSADAWPRLVGARTEVKRTLEEYDRARSAGAAAGSANSNVPVGTMPPIPPVAAAGGSGGGLPGGMANMFGGMPGAMGGGGAPDMGMLQNMMSDPNMMQTVMQSLNNPMVQNMMRNDPRLANNPMLQQSLQALQNNPEMISQFSQMMGDPNVRNRMSDMMQQQQQQPPGGAGAGGSSSGAADPFANGPDAMRRQMEEFQLMSQQFGGTSGGINTGGSGGGAGGASAGLGGSSSSGTNNTSNSGGGGGGNTDNDMTEEEMIAEAIRRSLGQS